MTEPDPEKDRRQVAADLVELVARTTAAMSPAEQARRLDPVLLKATLRLPPPEGPLSRPC